MHSAKKCTHVSSRHKTSCGLGDTRFFRPFGTYWWPPRCFCFIHVHRLDLPPSSILESSDSADKARQTFLSRLPLLQRRPARSGMRLEFAVLLIGSRKERHVHGIVMVEVYSESIPKPVSGAKGAAAHLSDGFVKRVSGLSFRRQFRPSQQGWISFEFWGSHSSILPPRGVNMACPVVDLSSSVAT